MIGILGAGGIAERAMVEPAREADGVHLPRGRSAGALGASGRDGTVGG